MAAEPLAERDQALLDRVARRIVELRMEVPAVLTLESVRPLSLVGSQALHFLQPLVQTLFHLPDYQRFAELIEHRENLERLTCRIEELAGERRARDAGSRAAESRRQP
jgi:hypothetical protein